MFLSIITINYNNKLGLEKTINSVRSQNSKNSEYIIIDGGSSDSSLDVIKINLDIIDYWVSEKDKGIYNAINKGLNIAKGDYIFFLNSGDLFYKENTLNNVIGLLSGEDIIYSNIQIQYENKDWIKTYPNSPTFSYFINDSLPHSAGVFISKKSFKNDLQYYDESLLIVSDWKWYLLALFKFDYSYKYIDVLVGKFDYTGISANPQNQQLLKEEKLKVLQHNFSRYYEDILVLLDYKQKYIYLSSSKFVKLAIKLKSLLTKFTRI